MKKTLMVVSFALCASLAFAQSNRVVEKATRQVVDKVALSSSDLESSSAGFTGSIFTKDGELFSCTFSTADANLYSLGWALSGEVVDGTTIPVHTNAGDYGKWHRFSSWSDLTQTGYPALYSRFRNTVAAYFVSPTIDDGFMLMSMIDNYAGWGGDGDDGVFDAWIRFDGINLTGVDLPRFNVYQFYRKFNSDKTYIDYSVDGGTTWSTYEINRKNIDVAGNSNTYGMKRATLPAALGNQANVSLRLRYVDESTPEQIAEGTGGGYFYVVDDVTVTAAPQNHLNITSNQYFEGFYQLMPQGLQVPVVWVSEFTNDGVQPQLNTTGKVYHKLPGQAATVLANAPLGTIAPEADHARAFIIDPLGYYDTNADAHDSDHGFTYDPLATATGVYACLPTTQAGANYFFSDINSNYYSNHIGDSITFDTLRYTVNQGTITDAAGQSRTAAIWGRDHGVLTYNGDGVDNGSGNYYAPGIVPSGSAWSDDYTQTSWNKLGYGTMVGYVTGNTVPEGWRILGMEMVASTTPGMEGIGAQIVPILWTDSLGADSNLYFNGVETGAESYVVKASDVNDVENLTFRTYQQGYNTIRVLYPEQPALEPNQVYHVGYALNADADFSVAATRNYFYRADTAVSFSEEAGLTDYQHLLTKRSGNGNIYSVFTRDVRGNSASIRAFNTTYYPMIRMIVGPSYHINKYKVSWECDNEDEGVFMNGNGEVICGESDSVAEGYPVSFYIQPEEGYTIDKILVNGVESSDYTINTDADGNEYGVMRIESVTSEMVFKCFFKQAGGQQSIDPVAKNVSMKLQPNPATSNVYVSLKGVSGNVNMSLIDMSGRVITTSQFNAENGANINVSNLAKGAYFVRITNNNFTKIEKLIVR